MTTEWTHEAHLIVRASDATTQNRTTLAECLSLNGSLESTVDELKMFDIGGVYRFSLSGSLPAQAYGVIMPVKVEMRDCFAAFIPTLTDARYFVIRREDDVLVLTNSGVTVVPQPNWSRAKTLQALNAEFGLQLIPEAE